jgi:hypothetical protein
VSKSGEFLVLDAEPGRFALHGWMNITLAVWTARVQVDALERLASASDAYSALHPEGLSNIHLVQHAIGLPDTRTRKRLVEISRGATPHLATVSAVVGGQGFWAGRMRSLITGVRMMVPGPFELRLVGSTEEIAEWLPQAHERRTGIAVDPEALRMWIARCDTRALPASSLVPAGPASNIAALGNARSTATTVRPPHRADPTARISADPTRPVQAPDNSPTLPLEAASAAPPASASG